MKFRRMLAAILSALMIASCMSFVAAAQEEAELAGTGVVKEITSGARGGDSTNIHTKYYDAVNDVLFSRITTAPGKTATSLHWDCYGWSFEIDDDGESYGAYRMRGNKAGVTPSPNWKIDGSFKTFNGTAPIKGDGTWETAVVKATGLKAGATVSQVQTHLLGKASSTAPHPAGTYLDVAIAVYANDEASAVAAANTASKYASEYDITFSLNYEGAEAIEGYVANPVRENYEFLGWATTADATTVIADMTCTAVPTAATTYYAIWKEIVPSETEIWVDYTNGSDDNVGNRVDKPVKTLAKANSLVPNNGTVYFMSDYPLEGSAAFGAANKTIKYKSYGDAKYTVTQGPAITLPGAVIFENFILNGVEYPKGDGTMTNAGEGPFRHKGFNLTFGEGFETAGRYQKNEYNICGGNYNNSNMNGGTVTVNNGSYLRKLVISEGYSIGKGTVNVVIGEKGNVGQLVTNHNANSSTKSGHQGKIDITVNGTVNSVVLGVDNGFATYSGLFSVTVGDGAKINTLYTVSGKGQSTYPRNNAVNAIEINGGTVSTIGKGTYYTATEYEETRTVIFNNGAKTAVNDAGAYVIRPDGAKMHASTTYNSTAYTATLDGYTYELEADTYDSVLIGDKVYTLAEEFENGFIPLSYFAKGENTVEFFNYEEAIKPAEHIKPYADKGYAVIYVSANGTGDSDGSTRFDTAAHADMASVLSAYVKENAKVVIALADGMPAGTAIPTTESGAEVIITSAYGNAGKDGGYISISGTSTPLRLGSGSSYTFDNIHFAVNNGAQNQIYASGSDVTVTSTVTHSATSQGLVLAHGRNSTDSFAGGTITADANVYLLRSGAGEGNNVTGDIRYVINSNAVIGILGAGGHAGNVAGTDNATLKGSAYVDINGGTVKQLNPGYKATVNGDVIVNINNGGVVESLKSQFEDNAGVLKGDYVVYLNDGTIKTVETFNGGTFEGKKVLIVNEDTSDVPATADSLIPYIVTSTGDGTVTFDTASDKLIFAMGNGVKYIRVTNGEDVKSFNVDGDEVALMADIAVDITEGTTTVEFLTEGTEGKTVTFISDGEEVQSGLVEVGTVPTAPVLTKTGYTLSWDKEIVSVTEDVTYTAVWTAKEYDVTFNAGDGTFENGKEVTVKATFDSEISAPTEVPVREGYTFAGWTPEVGTLTTEGASFTAIWNLNKYTITFNAGDGKFSDDSTVKTVEADHGTTPTAPETPSKDGYTFKEWTPAIEAATGAVTYTATYEKDFATTSTYKTYGYYDALSDTYKVEVRFSGAKVNQGSFGFNFPTEYMTFKSATANTAAGIEFLGADSPIYANGEGFYADTWAVSLPGFAGHIDATAEEVLIANIDFTMTEAQRTAFINAGLTLTEYVVASPNAKYHNGENYLATLYATDFSTTRQAIVYDSHTDEEVTTKAFYTTYGTYDSLREEYTIDIKVKGAKINVGAFGLKFNPAHMTFDPAVDEYGNAVNVTMASGIANYLGIVFNNTAEGYAFAFDGSSVKDGYIDASLEEVLIATVKVKMTADQRTAFENAGKKMEIFVPTANDNITADALAAYYNGENYLISLYTNGLEIPRIPAIYEAHYDEVLEVTEAHVEVTVKFTSKHGATASNIAYISLDNEATALETAGNTSTSATKTYEFLEVGKNYKIRVEKNGYLAAEVNYTVAAGDNKIVIDLIAGDIKGAKTDRCGDGTIDLSDFVRLIRAFDTDASDDFIATVDIDESGAVNVADLAIIKANYNKESAETVITYNGEEAAG